MQCPEDPNAVLTKTVKPSLPESGSNYQTVQAAYNAAVNGDVIGLFSNTIENLTLGGNKTLKITQCTTARVTAADPSLPVWNVTSTGKLTIVGPDSVGGTVGWRIATNGHDIRGLRASNATTYGVLVLSNQNGVSWNSVTGCPVGIRVEGDSNTLRGGTVSGNAGDGVQLGATANSNSFRTANVQSNGGNGIVVEGNANTVSDNGRVDDNGINGILVLSNSNTIKNNAAGSDDDTGNAAAGISVSGNNNTLEANKTNANGTDGFLITGTGNKLKNNQSNQDDPGEPKENVGPEYRFTNSITNQGSNKKDSLNFTATAAGSYE